MTTDNTSAAVHISPEHRADYVPPAAPMPSLSAMMRGQTERAFAHALRQMSAVLEGTVENLYLDGTTKLKSPQKHRLDEIGGVDGMRIVFRGQVEELIRLHPKKSRLKLSDRVNAALKICDEHLQRTNAFGQYLTEKTAHDAALECCNTMAALHMVLQPCSSADRDRIMAAYWARKNPVEELERYAKQ